MINYKITKKKCYKDILRDINIMFRYFNLKQKYGRISYFGNYVNSFQILQLAKHDIYPHHNKQLMKNVPTNIIINSGKLVVNMKNIKKDTECTIFAEDDKLIQCEEDHDIILTDRKYVLTIAPGIFFNFYSYEKSDFQLFYKSDDSIKYYTFNNKNNYDISSIEYLK